MDLPEETKHDLEQKFVLKRNVTIVQASAMRRIIEALIGREMNIRCQVTIENDSEGEEVCLPPQMSKCPTSSRGHDKIFSVYRILSKGSPPEEDGQRGVPDTVDYLYVKDGEGKNLDRLIDDRIVGYELVSTDPLMWYLFNPTEVSKSSTVTRIRDGLLRTTIVNIPGADTDLIEWRGFALRTLRGESEESLSDLNDFLGPVLALRGQGIFSFTVSSTEPTYIDRVIEIAEMWEIKYLKRYKQFLYFSKPTSKIIHGDTEVGGLGEVFLRDAVMKSYRNIRPTIRVFDRRNRILFTVRSWSLKDVVRIVGGERGSSITKWEDAYKQFKSVEKVI